ncbi:MAG: M20/M25/M40 family metallo-hydrolase, partial [bacterium]
SFAYGGKGEVIAPIVFIGYGISEPEKGRDDLAGVDLKGKIALAIRGVPPGNGEEYWTVEHYNGYKSSKARDAGAIGYLQIESDRAIQGTIQPQYFRADLPAFWISQQTCDLLLSGTSWTLDSLRARANANSEGYHLELTTQILMEANAGIIPAAPTCNVLAYLPGADPTLAHEIVLVGAHMDHLGVDAIGRIYNGAEDNASGTALMLELARTLAQDPIRPRRSVYFCAFAGEELGLVGSEEFVQNSPLLLDSVIAMINMDMVGQGGEGISIGGSMNFPPIWEIWESALSDSAQDRIFHFKPGDYGDHAPFEEVGIPAFFVASRGQHLHYHHPDDDAPLIQPEVLAEVGEVVYRGVQAIVGHPAPLAEPHYYERYLFRSAETVRIGACDLAVQDSDDFPDLILHPIGEFIDPSSRNRLRKLLVELEQWEDRFQTERESSLKRISDFGEIPSGRRFPAVIAGLAFPTLVEGEAQLYDTVKRLGIRFVRIPLSPKNAYFGVRGMKKAGKELLLQLENTTLLPIWEVLNAPEAEQLIGVATVPLVVHCRGSLSAALTTWEGKFLLIEARSVKMMNPGEFEALCKKGNWRTVGVQVEDAAQALPLIQQWLELQYSPQQMRGLLGENLIRFLKKYSL